ncbi:50S ribosomal protein L4 [Coxiella endosymbiont of Ornithodoros amblus]|uniref:50S ribosomal protein L4 n=1 Tax=Coxiella endosymbiont of Ornithodoros amblus TaxID=1656166 RepID=UPI00244DC57C|nr:50S ribosomal protein L4 [Coxiella endosymbiont of Ornithodoros amblus]MBW5802550.1 50S ribosomal protein L4 [Coxiella endosymbiont of Ornithodoros amblus]
MMELPVNSFDKKKASTLTVADSAFGSEYKEALVHQVVNAYLAGGRAGTKAQKTRREVSGGGAKPWRQKGTGRSRAGSSRSSLWRSGGVAFAAKPRDFTQKVNRKMYRSAMASILSELIRREQLVVVDSLKLNEPKTRELKESLKRLNLQNVLIIIDGDDRNINLASRNMVGVSVCDALHLDPVSLVAAENIVVSVDAIKRLEERLS